MQANFQTLFRNTPFASLIHRLSIYNRKNKDLFPDAAYKRYDNFLPAISSNP